MKPTIRLDDAAIAEQAAACGYPNAQYFSRAFAAATGLPPDTWRGRKIRQSV